ncbi:HAD-IC family P-type ATPase, partial [Candidatus Parcubacteria bacterium]|nr:HAD-IC family P-type ATPase [Candidatus Parcubacteria bacterium]
GDLVVLISGDKIPADGELIQGEILVSEAILTGEEEGVKKSFYGDKNLFMGTSVLAGKGIMEVKKIGKETEIGKIGKSLVEISKEKTPLQKKLEELSKNLAEVIVVVCALVFLGGILREREIFSTFKTAIVLAVAAIPEALPVAITVVLALGMRRILKKKGLVKTLLAVETLGSTSVICTDKTGTLTEGKMKVVETYFLDREMSILNMILNNEQRSSLELAVFDFGNQNLNKTLKEKIEIAKEIFEEPFDSAKKYSLSLQKIGESKVCFLMGAPEILLEFSKNDEIQKKEILEKLDEFAKKGLRVVGLAFKKEGDLKEKKDFIFSGLLGILDPPRKEVKDLIEFAKKAGIEVKIVTGDYKETAINLAKNLGIEVLPENVMEGKELEKISIEELKEKIDKIKIFARVLPQQKRKIVDCLQEKGEIVAMTGDGVNDALALKEADIGVAVGEATEVAKESADLILLDSNFKTIISACEEGRLVLSNIKKTVGYVLSNSFLEIAVIFFSGLFGWPAPLNIPQILWLHLICDGPPDLMFAFEPKEKDLMEKKPIDIKKEPILDKFLISLIATISVVVTAFCLLIYWQFGIKQNNLILGSTLVFAALGSVDLIYALSFKNLKRPIIKTEKFFENKFLFLGILYGFLLLALAIYLPSLNKVLKTAPLESWHLILVWGIGATTTLILELAKSLAKFFNQK